MKKGTVIHGFRLLDDSPVTEYKSRGLWFKHLKTGMEVYHLYNDDAENLFSYAFKTLPTDSSGVAHILEHTVLCGSQKYQVKDPFMILGKQSVKTFLNAMTYPDKTIYPASSFIEADYFNLMDVYGDAVFFPLLSQKMFQQEGHRLEYDTDGKLYIQGVVYNEMKGVYSSHENIAADSAVSSVTRGSLYEYDYGGNPDAIPNLTYEQFCEFHHVYYHPSNCRLFLYGNIPTEKQLEFINRRFLTAFENVPVPPMAPAIPPVPPLSGPVFERIRSPADGTTGNTVLCNWLIGSCGDITVLTELQFLGDLLLGNDASPLQKALLESGLGEDVSPVSGLQAHLQQPIFSCGLRGVSDSVSPEVIKAFVFDTLATIQKDGFDPDLIQSSLLSMEVSSREITRGWGGPFSLTLMQRSLSGWIHGKHPAETMCDRPRFDHIRKILHDDPRYFSTAIAKYLLQNNHCSVVTVCPDELLLADQESALRNTLDAKDAAFTPEERKKIKTQSEELVAFQQQPDDLAMISRIPHVTPTDLTTMLEPLPITQSVCGSIPVFSACQPVNGMFYMSAAIPVDTLDADSYPLVSFYADVLTGLGFNGLPWNKASILTACCTGNLSASVRVMESVAGAAASAIVDRDWLFIDMKTITEKTKDAIKLVFDMLQTVSFNDPARIRDLLTESLNAAKSAIIPAGHRFAVSRSSRSFSRNAALTELWFGLDQLDYLTKLATYSDAEIIARLEAIHQKILSSGMIVYLCGDAVPLHEAQNFCAELLPTLPFTAPVDRNPNRYTIPVSSASAEAYTATMQVGYAAVTVPAAVYGSSDCGAELLLSHLLSTGLLWEQIRMKGGAYGVNACSANTDNSFYFATFRDPSPDVSPTVFEQCLAAVAKSPVDSVELEKIMTGLYSNLFPIRTPAGKGATALVYALTGDSVALRESRLKSMLSTTPEQLQNAALRILRNLDRKKTCVIAPSVTAESFAGKNNIAVQNVFAGD